jgi:hypothetical protein
LVEGDLSPLPDVVLQCRDHRNVTSSALHLLTGHWGPINIHYRLIWDCVPFLSPLTTRRGCGGGILTRLHTGLERLNFSQVIYNIQFVPHWKFISSPLHIQPGHWGPITILYCLIWDCVPFLSPLTTRRDCGGGILSRLHTGSSSSSSSSSSIVE